MGADMVGYLVKGPVKFTKKQIDAAKKTVLERARKLADTGILICPACYEENDTRSQEYDGTCSHCSLALPATLDQIKTLADANKRVQEFVAGWPPIGCRDVCIRRDPDDHKQFMVFAGDMTWGDEPAGGGYEYLKDLLASGIAEQLGIR